MKEAIDVLDRIGVRFLLWGSYALQIHGFEFDQSDIDVWLDPNLDDENWHSEVKRIAGGHEIEYREHRHEAPPFRFARIKTDPFVDLMTRPKGFIDADFDVLHETAMITRFGRVPTIRSLLRSKLTAARPKDFRHVMRCARQLLNG